MEFASPSFLESILKAYRTADRGATTPPGKILTDEQGKPINLCRGEAAAQAIGFRPERMAQISGEHWTMENAKKHFAEKRNDLYARVRLAKTQVIFFTHHQHMVHLATEGVDGKILHILRLNAA